MVPVVSAEYGHPERRLVSLIMALLSDRLHESRIVSSDLTEKEYEQLKVAAVAVAVAAFVDDRRRTQPFCPPF
jgi:hypothetical protein